MAHEYSAYLRFDGKEGIWFTNASNIQGLGASGPDLDQVADDLILQAPELLRDNVYSRSPDPWPLHVEFNLIAHTEDAIVRNQVYTLPLNPKPWNGMKPG